MARQISNLGCNEPYSIEFRDTIFIIWDLNAMHRLLDLQDRARELERRKENTGYKRILLQ